MPHIGNNVKYLIRESHRTQKEVGEKLGYSQFQNFHQQLNKEVWRSDILEAVSKELNVPVQLLFSTNVALDFALWKSKTETA